MRLAAMMPAMRATESTSPFLSADERIRRAGVGLEKRMTARAVARRVVGGLYAKDAAVSGGGVAGEDGSTGGGMETMWTAPEDERCVSWAALVVVAVDVAASVSGVAGIAERLVL